MKYTRIVDIAGALAASFLVVIFKGWFDKSSLNPFFSIVFALLLAVASNIFIEAFLLFLPKKIYLLRKCIYPMAKYEGTWLQVHYRKKEGSEEVKQCDPNEYALCYIQYSPDTDEYSFRGDHYKHNITDSVRFSSINMFFDSTRNGFRYSVQGRHSGELYDCWGYIDFINEDDGKGSFFDLGTKLSETEFRMIRIEKELAQKIKEYKDGTDVKTLLQGLTAL
jgi:hypothetical protein